MKYVEKLRNSGLRPTKQRLQICEVLFNTEKTFHFTINELEQKIKKQINSKISLATVYNTVHAFEKKGVQGVYLCGGLQSEGYQVDRSLFKAGLT